MKTASHEMVENVLKKMEKTPAPEIVKLLTKRMKEYPDIFEYIEDFQEVYLPDTNVEELYFYALVILEVMLKDRRKPFNVTLENLESAEDINFTEFNKISEIDDSSLIDKTSDELIKYNQFPLWSLILSQLMDLSKFEVDGSEKDSIDNPFNDENYDDNEEEENPSKKLRILSLDDAGKEITTEEIGDGYHVEDEEYSDEETDDMSSRLSVSLCFKSIIDCLDK